MAVLSVPFHLDEQLVGFVPPVSPDEVIAPALPAGDPWEGMAVLYAEVAGAIDVDELPVVLSGDCTTALAVVAGLQCAEVDPSVVWFDAHGDLQTPETSTSGYLCTSTRTSSTRAICPGCCSRRPTVRGCHRSSPRSGRCSPRCRWSR